MSKIVLNINLESNEIFDEQLNKAVQARAKQMAREAFQQTLEEETSRLVEKAMKDAGGYYSIMVNKVADKLSSQMHRNDFIDEKRIEAIIQKQMEDFVQARFTRYGGVDSYVEEFLRKSVAAAILKPE